VGAQSKKAAFLCEKAAFFFSSHQFSLFSQKSICLTGTFTIPIDSLQLYAMQL